MAACASPASASCRTPCFGQNIVPDRSGDFDQALRGRGLQGRRQARRARRHPRAPRRHHPAADRARRQDASGPAPAGAAEGNGFRVTVEMTSLLGTAGEDFASILTSLGYRVRRTPKVVGPRRDHAAGRDRSADRPRSSMPPPTPRQPRRSKVPSCRGPSGRRRSRSRPRPPISVRRADRTLPKPHPAEPQFDEVWFPGGRRPDNPRHQGQGNAARHAPMRPGEARPRAPDRRAASIATPQQRHVTPPGGRQPEGPPPAQPQRPRFAKPPEFRRRQEAVRGRQASRRQARQREREDWKEHRPREKRDVPLDPDSPWAKLAALRNPKPDSLGEAAPRSLAVLRPRRQIADAGAKADRDRRGPGQFRAHGSHRPPGGAGDVLTMTVHQRLLVWQDPRPRHPSRSGRGSAGALRGSVAARPAAGATRRPSSRATGRAADQEGPARHRPAAATTTEMAFPRLADRPQIAVLAAHLRASLKRVSTAPTRRTASSAP